MFLLVLSIVQRMAAHSSRIAFPVQPVRRVTPPGVPIAEAV